MNRSVILTHPALTRGAVMRSYLITLITHRGRRAWSHQGDHIAQGVVHRQLGGLGGFPASGTAQLTRPSSSVFSQSRQTSTTDIVDTRKRVRNSLREVILFRAHGALEGEVDRSHENCAQTE